MLGNIIKAISGKGMSSSQKVQKGFTKTLTVDDLVDDATLALVANKEAILGDWKVNPQTKVILGFGNQQFQSNQGTIYLSLFDNTPTTPVELDDRTEIRLLITDYNGRVKGVSLAERYANLKTGATDPVSRFKFPEGGVEALENDNIRMIAISPAAITFSKANSKMFVSATEYWLGS